MVKALFIAIFFCTVISIIHNIESKFLIEVVLTFMGDKETGNRNICCTGRETVWPEAVNI